MKKLICRKAFDISSDQVAIKGRDNYLFLYEGFNRYYQMYFDRSRIVSGVIDAWNVAMKSWNESARMKSCDLHMIIVPNKATLLKKYYPLRLPGAQTPYLSILELNSIVKVFSPQEISNVFRRTDTHLSPKGNFEFAIFIIKTLGYEFDVGALVPTGSQHAFGDLGSKFEPPISENVEFFALANQSTTPLVLLDNSSEYLPDRHIGITIQLINPKAPFKKSLRIFGNSFLGNSSEYSALWILGLAFQKVSFNWSPTVDPQLIEEEEIVIFQTCERFLGYSPDHWK